MASSSAFSASGTANPATLIPLSPEDSAPLYVEMMGGSDKILAKGKELHDAGRYMEASEILNKLVPGRARRTRKPRTSWPMSSSSSATSRRTRDCATASSPALTNCAPAYPDSEVIDSTTADVIRAMSTELFLNFLGIKMDSRKAEGLRFTINLITPDNGEKFVIEMDNATLTNLEGFLSDTPDLTLTINRSDLEQTMTGEKALEDQIAAGEAVVEGDVSILAKLAGTMVDFDPMFEILPGTSNRDPELASAKPYRAVTGATIAE